MKTSLGAALGLLGAVVGLGCAGSTDPSATGVAAPFGLTLSPGSLNVAQGSSTPPYGVSLSCNKFSGEVTLTLERSGTLSLPPGMAATFTPNPVAGITALFTITVPLGVPAETYQLLVRGAAAGVSGQAAPLTVRVLSASGT